MSTIPAYINFLNVKASYKKGDTQLKEYVDSFLAVFNTSERNVLCFSELAEMSVDMFYLYFGKKAATQEEIDTISKLISYMRTYARGMLAEGDIHG
jgi:hypothetical protein